MVIKAELHAHLEGTLSPQKLVELCAKNNVTIPDGLLSDDQSSYMWAQSKDADKSLMAFVQTYDRATAAIKSPDDYFDITYDYLKRCAQEGSIYEELTVYADPEPTVGISYMAMIDAISDAIDRARIDFDIECRILAAFVRHFGIDRSLQDAKTVISYPHKYVTGITMAGAETAHKVADFVPAYNLVTEKLGLQKTAHAGEATGPKTIRDCYELLGIKRFGHMVRVVEDPSLMKQMAEVGATAEVCISSNISLNVYPNIESHPIKQIYDSGIKVTLNSDDPPFFHTTIGQEYDIAETTFGFKSDQLLKMTENALDAAFVDNETRDQLKKKIRP
jgi:adenosine deaminase